MTKLKPIDELILVQDIISKQEEFTFKVFSWAIGIITALTLGFFHKEVTLNVWLYMISSLIIIGIFLSVAKRHWETFYRAVKRSEDIEKEVQDNCYTGIKLNDELRNGETINNVFKYPRLYQPYLVLVLLVLVSGISKLLLHSLPCP